MEGNGYNIIIHADQKASNIEYRGHYKTPTMNEVTVVIVNQDCDKRDIVICARYDRLYLIAETNQAYDALQ